MCLDNFPHYIMLLLFAFLISFSRRKISIWKPLQSESRNLPVLIDEIAQPLCSFSPSFASIHQFPCELEAPRSGKKSTCTSHCLSVDFTTTEWRKQIFLCDLHERLHRLKYECISRQILCYGSALVCYKRCNTARILEVTAL